MIRSRRSLVLGVLLFCAVQAGLSRSIESDALPVRDPIFTEKIERLRTHSEFWSNSTDRPRLLALGSSRTQLLIDCDRLAPEFYTFNFGCSSCGTIAQSLYLRRLLDAGVHAEVLLIEIHPALLAELPEPFEMRWLQPHRLRADESSALRELGCSSDAAATTDCHWFQSSSHYRRALLNEYAPGLLPGSQAIRRNRTSDHRGYVLGIEPSPQRHFELTENSLREYGPAFADYRPGGPACAALERMIDLGQQRGMHVVLFVTPESTAFQTAYGGAGNARFDAFLNRLSNERAVPILRSRGWLNDGDFADGHHATPRGAAAFTDRLKGELPR